MLKTYHAVISTKTLWWFEICISNFSAMSFILNGQKDPENEVRERESEAREDEIEIAVTKLKLP